MILGMSLATFTMVHVIISLIAIGTGLVVMFGMLGSKRMPGLTATFLAFTVLTSASGFLFSPSLFEKLSPGHVIGLISLVLLAIACLALYGMKLVGAWRWIYALTALLSLYLNMFVLVIQSFLNLPTLRALVPGSVVQGVVLAFFVVAITAVIWRYRPANAGMMDDPIRQ